MDKLHSTDILELLENINGISKLYRYIFKKKNKIGIVTNNYT